MTHPIHPLLSREIFSCNDCPRLRSHCKTIAETKRRAFLDQTYWGLPITGFGDPHARLVLVGLAPAAHGANRTGRIFTGDRSGEWLYRALHKAGFANQPTSEHIDDGLRLKDCYITCVVKCAPPDNKPLPQELQNCERFLKKEIQLMAQARVWVALGQIAYQRIWGHLNPGSRRPPFGHGKILPLPAGQWLILSYHPSQQNTFTGRLTEPMFDRVFTEANRILNPEKT